jgi:hypothetical protein
MWVYSRGPFTYPSWWIQLFCGWSPFGCLAVFPRPKGRTNSSPSFFFDNLVVLILNRCGVWSTIIPGPCSWLKLFHLAVFVFLSQGSCSRLERLQIRPVFVASQFFRLVNNQIQKFELEAKCNSNNFFHHEELSATPAIPGFLFLFFFRLCYVLRKITHL